MTGTKIKNHFFKLGLLAATLNGCAKLEFHGPAPTPPPPPPFAAPRRPLTPRLPDTLTAPERDAALRLNGIEASLERLLVTRLNLASGLSEAETIAVVKLAQDLDLCGLSAKGPACLDRDQNSAEISLPPGPVDPQIHTVFSRLFDAGLNAPVVYRFSFNPLNRANKKLELDVFSAAGPDLRPLIKAELTQDFVPTAWNRLANPRDIRELFHLSRGLIRLAGSPDRADTKTGLAVVYKENVARFGAVDQGIYPYETLHLSLNEFDLDNAAKILLSTPFLKSSQLEAQELAADTILTLEPKRNELQTLAVESLYNDRTSLRTLGVNALKAATDRSDRETSMVISKIIDPTETVKRTAIEATAQMPIGDGNMANVMQLVLSPDPELRMEGLKLLGKSDSSRAAPALILSLTDVDPRVRRAALESLATKKLYSADVARLTPLLSNPDSSVRGAAAELLAKIDVDAARDALIQQLDDPDRSVRNGISASLKNAPLSRAQGEALGQYITSKNEDVRATVTQIISTIPGSAVTTALIQNLDDPSPEMRFLKSTTLARRARSSDLVPELFRAYRSPRASVRLTVVNFLSHLQTPAVWSFLRAKDLVETDLTVRAALDTIVHRPLTSRTVRGKFGGLR